MVCNLCVLLFANKIMKYGFSTKQITNVIGNVLPIYLPIHVFFVVHNAWVQ